jgi:hypothetical protein
VTHVRSKIVLGLLVLLLGGAGALLVTRKREPHTSPLPGLPAAPSAAASASASSSSPVADLSASAPVTSASAATSASAPPADAGPVPLLDRPLRVMALGWELGAPGLLANDGPKGGAKSVFPPSGLEVRIGVADAMQPLEEALARGGGDENGADVAVVPLPSFVASYERLRALSPEVFLVVGFSRGREALAGPSEGLPTGPVKGDVKLAGVAGAPSTFLGLFVLDAAGVPATSVRLVPPGGHDEKEAAYVAIDRAAAGEDAAGGRKILLTTADAPRLVPLVAIAPHGLLSTHEKALVALARGWMDGIKKLGADAPGAARQVASAEGAPEPLALMRRLGDVQPATLTDDARMLGLSGRGALTVGTLFQRSWGLWRGTSALATPPPEAPPVATGVVAALVRAGGAAEGSEASVAPKAAPDGAKPLLVHRQEKLDEEALVETIGLLAAVFERATLRVAVTSAGGVDGGKTKKLIEAAEGRFDLPPGRVIPAKKAGAKGAAVVEVVGP